VLGFIITLGPSCRLVSWVAAQHPGTAIRAHNLKMGRLGPDDRA
jgi:hypothetical protein